MGPEIHLTASCFSTGYGSSEVLHIPSLSVHGHCIAIIGHNGSGKSTLLKSLLGLLSPRSGHLGLWTSEEKLLVPEKHMAFSPESGAVFADMTVENYLKLWCRIKQRDALFYRKAGKRFMETLQVEPLLGRYGRELSKGQKRRVQTAVGYLCNPRVFLFDEPFDGLDIQQAHRLADVMREEAGSMSLILSSHRMDVIERLADHIIVLNQGQVLTSGEVSQVCSDLGHRSLIIKQQHTDQLAETVFELQSRFSSEVIHRLGSQISITGKRISPEVLSHFFEEKRASDYTIEEHQPSLGDAMSYHLKQLAVETGTTSRA